MIIYKLTNLVNGKAYVGQTKHALEKRLQGHLNYESYIGRALRKHGLENFKTEVIREAQNQEELNALEIALIQEHNTLHPNGYNLDKGGTHKGLCEASMLKLRTSRKRSDKRPLSCQIVKRNDSGKYRLRVYTKSGIRLNLGSFRTEKRAFKHYRQLLRGRVFDKPTCEVDFVSRLNKFRLRVMDKGIRKTIKSNFKTKNEAYKYFYQGVA